VRNRIQRSVRAAIGFLRPRPEVELDEAEPTSGFGLPDPEFPPSPPMDTPACGAVSAVGVSSSPGPLLLSELVCAYNEEANIGNLLEASLRQVGPGFRLKEVIVVASGCTDHTEEIVRAYQRLDPRVRLLSQPQRRGKAAAVRAGLAAVAGDVILIENADTIPAPGSFEKVVAPFRDPQTSLVCLKPVPMTRGSGWTQKLVRTLWGVHHYVSKIAPKAGEAFAMRTPFLSVPEDIEDDDTYLGVAASKLGSRSVYSESAEVFNRAPTVFRDFVAQRARINRQILGLKQHHGILTITWTPDLGRAVLWYLSENPRSVLLVGALGAIEFTVRMGVLLSRLFPRPRLVSWAPIHSTKTPLPDAPTTEPIRS
jgi:glycosyltransferase involved in cell wall biosynthesis